jgi:hypothetical protein
VVRDAVSAPPSAELEPADVLHVQLKPYPAPPPALEERPRLTPREIAQAIPKLKAGMTRSEVEGIVGQAAPGNVHPPILSAARGTYFMTYEVDLEQPAAQPAQPKPRALVTLEFDATKHGHTLLGIHSSEPRF